MDLIKVYSGTAPSFQVITPSGMTDQNMTRNTGDLNSTINT